MKLCEKVRKSQNILWGIIACFGSTADLIRNKEETKKYVCPKWGKIYAHWNATVVLKYRIKNYKKAFRYQKRDDFVA